LGRAARQAGRGMKITNSLNRKTYEKEGGCPLLKLIEDIKIDYERF